MRGSPSGLGGVRLGLGGGVVLSGGSPSGSKASVHVLGKETSRDLDRIPPGQEAGGTHSTGMLSLSAVQQLGTGVMNSGDGVCARVQNSQLSVVCTTMMTSWMIHLCKAIKEEV